MITRRDLFNKNLPAGLLLVGGANVLATVDKLFNSWHPEHVVKELYDHKHQFPMALAKVGPGLSSTDRRGTTEFSFSNVSFGLEDLATWHLDRLTEVCKQQGMLCKFEHAQKLDEFAFTKFIIYPKPADNSHYHAIAGGVDGNQSWHAFGLCPIDHAAIAVVMAEVERLDLMIQSAVTDQKHSDFSEIWIEFASLNAGYTQEVWEENMKLIKNHNSISASLTGKI